MRGFLFWTDQPEGLFRLISETTISDPNSLNGGVTYTWDEVGNRTSRTTTLPPAAGVTNQTYNGLYDSNDQFTNHTFDFNGSTTNADGRTYTYDSRRRITRIQGTGLDVAYQYDSDGNLLKKTNNLTSEITKYVFDTQNATGYSQTLEEIVNGTPKVRYAYGSRLISRAEFDGSQWHRKFYHFDGEGNVAFLTDETGAITDRYTYADGRVIRHDGTSANEFLMKGERVDKDTGLVFLRARWMNPEYERFMTRDSFEGEQDDPITGNTYLFGNADGVNNSDHSGNWGDFLTPPPITISQPKWPSDMTSSTQKRTALTGLSISENGKTFLKTQEGLVRKIRNIGDGVLTVGYGHNATAHKDVGKFLNDDGSPKTIDDKIASPIFNSDVLEIENSFKSRLQNTGAFYQYEYDSLISFAFSLGLGEGGISWGYHFWDRIKKEEYLENVPGVMVTTFPGSLEGTPKRRKDEAALFKDGIYSFQGKPLN